MTTATSEASAAAAITNGTVASSGSAGPWVTMNTSFSVSATGISLRQR